MPTLTRKQLLALAKDAKVPARHDMTVAKLRAALNLDTPILDSGTTLGDPTPPTDDSMPGIPVFLRRGIQTPEQAQRVKDLVRRELYGTDRKYIMPSSPESEYFKANGAVKTPAQKAKRKGSTPTWVFALGMDLSDEAAALVLGKLPKQARLIAEFVRSEGRVDLPKLIERARHFLKTRQEPERIVQYYRGALIASGVIRVVYDDPSIPVEDAGTIKDAGAVADLVLEKLGLKSAAASH